MKILLPLIILLFASISFGQKGYITADSANLRKLPNAQSEILLEIPFSSVIQITSKKHLNGWYAVTYKKKKGWLHGNTFSFENPALSPPKLKEIEVEPIDRTEWFYIGKSVGNTGGQYFYKIDTLKTDALENTSGWIKVIPNNTREYAKNYQVRSTLNYVMMFATVDCKDKRLGLESSIFYDKSMQILTPRKILMNSYRDPIVPNSIGEAIWSAFCF